MPLVGHSPFERCYINAQLLTLTLYSSNIYELDFSILQLPKGAVPLDMMHHMDHKTPRILKVPIFNTNNTISSLGKNLPIAT